MALLGAMASSSPESIDIASLARAIRFALVCVLLGLCYLNLHCALGINAFMRQETANGRQWTLIEEKSASICSNDWSRDCGTFIRGY